MKKIINSHKSILFLDGTLPSKKMMGLIHTKVPIIAADGAADRLRALDLTPTVVVGDGDGYKQKIENRKTRVIEIAEQETTDFEKCIAFAKEAKLFPALVLGMNGGEIDHILGNAQVFLKHAAHFNLYFLDFYEKPHKKTFGMKLGIPLTDEKLSLKIKKASTLSLISFDRAVVRSEGLRWELKDFPLSAEGVLALRNVSIKSHVSFEVKKGKALLIIDV